MKRFIQLIAIFISLVFAVSCSQTQKNSAPIRIGINAWPGYEFLYLAQEKGFFEKEGVNVRIVEFNSLADGRRAYERGQLDGLACTLIEHIQILDSSNRSPKITIVADYSNGADVILANQSIGSIQDLKGARIGLEVDSLGVFMLARVLDNAGLTLSDVEVKPLDQISIESAFCSNELDVAITYPPASLNMQKSCQANPIFSSADIPEEIVDIVVLEESVFKGRPEDVNAIIQAFFNAQRWAYENPDEAFTLMGAREGISSEEFGKSLSDGIFIAKASDQKHFFDANGPLKNALEHCEKILRETNQLRNPSRIKGSIYEPLIVRVHASNN